MDCKKTVDPVVADPVRQDNDKRNNIQIYTEIPYQSTRCQRAGTKLPSSHILSLSCRTGSPTAGSTGCRENTEKMRKKWRRPPIFAHFVFFSAKASFSAYLLGNILLKTGRKVHFSEKKKHDQFCSSFLFLPFSLFCLEMAKICCFCFSKRQKSRQKTRPPPFFRILVSGGDSECILGCILGLRGVLCSVGGAGDCKLCLELDWKNWERSGCLV